MNLLVTVCARAGSKGVKSKNTRDFLKLPIAYYSLSAYNLFCGRYAAEYDSCIVALNTDSEQLMEQFSKTKVESILIPRRAVLAGDRVSKIDVVRDTLIGAEKKTGALFDVILDLDLTSPLRKVQDIKNVLDAVLADENADVALSVTEARRNPHFNQLVRDSSGYFTTAIKSNFVARQQAPEVFDANASIYAYRPAYLKNNNGILLHAKLVGAMMDDTGILDIDSERDFRLMEVVARYLYETEPAYGEVREHVFSILK